MQLQVDAETTLRPVARADTESLFHVIDANRSYLRVWLPWVDRTLSPEDTRAFIESSIEGEVAGASLATLIVRQSEICGVVGLDSIDLLHQSADVGYWLRADAQGKGLMTRSVARISDHACDPIGLHRLGLRAAPGNLRSRALAERLGFQEEGILRGAERHGDGFRDLVSYSLLNAERANRRV